MPENDMRAYQGMDMKALMNAPRPGTEPIERKPGGITQESEALWQMLDDIDTLSDMIKPTDEAGYKAFFDAAMKKAARRYTIHSSDGYNLY